MKRVTTLLIVMFLLLSLFGCEKSGDIFYLTTPKEESNTSDITTAYTDKPTDDTEVKTVNTKPIQEDTRATATTNSPESNEPVSTIETSPEESSDYPETPDSKTVYWLKNGKVYHLFHDCSYIKNEYFTGTLEECGITKLCSRCEKKVHP